MQLYRPDYTIDMAMEFIRSLLRDREGMEIKSRRGPYLAKMEIKKRHKMLTQSEEVQSCGNPSLALI